LVSSNNGGRGRRRRAGVVREAEGRGCGGDRAPPEEDAGCSKGAFRRLAKYPVPAGACIAIASMLGGKGDASGGGNDAKGDCGGGW